MHGWDAQKALDVRELVEHQGLAVSDLHDVCLETANAPATWENDSSEQREKSQVRRQNSL